MARTRDLHAPPSVSATRWPSYLFGRDRLRILLIGVCGTLVR